MLPCGSAAAITVRPISAVARNQDDRDDQHEDGRAGHRPGHRAADLAGAAAVYMRMVMCGRQAPPRTTVSSELIMSIRGLGPPANCRPECRRRGSDAAVWPRDLDKTDPAEAPAARPRCRPSSITDLQDLDEGGALHAADRRVADRGVRGQ